MDKKSVRDVIGEPESWPNHLNGHSKAPPDIREAIISDVFSFSNQLAVHTQGSVCGETFSVFEVEDHDLRERTLRALKLGAKVHEAVAVEI